MAERTEKSLDANHVAPELVELRRQIDAMDAQIVALLKQRTEIVQQVGKFKKKQNGKGCMIRPGREADMLRRIWSEFADGPFSPVAACAIWRIIIAASTAVEAEMRISVYAPDSDATLYWLAREYFGSLSPVARHPNCNRVVGDVVDGKAEVGILPPLTDEVNGTWWLTLAQQEENPPRIFAHVPFVTSQSEPRRHASFAIARIDAEPTGDDITLIAIEAADTSINRLTTAFAMAGMKASRIAFVNSMSGNTVHHLLQVQEFVAPTDPRLANVLGKIGEGLVYSKVLGSYANPIITTATC